MGATMILADQHPDESVKAEIGYLDPIEGVRGVAVLWVILFHYFYVRDPAAHDPGVALVTSLPVLETIVRNGYLGVDLFFLITGFLLVLPWAAHAFEGRAAPVARDFYVRRIRRIVPAYYMQLLLLLVLIIPLLRGFDYWR